MRVREARTHWSTHPSHNAQSPYELRLYSRTEKTETTTPPPVHPPANLTTPHTDGTGRDVDNTAASSSTPLQTKLLNFGLQSPTHHFEVSWLVSYHQSSHARKLCWPIIFKAPGNTFELTFYRSFFLPVDFKKLASWRNVIVSNSTCKGTSVDTLLRM